MTTRPVLISSRPDITAKSDHRAAGSLATVAGSVRMQTTTRIPEGDELRAVLEEPGGRVDTVARLHRDPAAAPSEAAIDLGKFLQDSAGAVVAALSAPGCITLLTDCEENCLLARETVMPIGLIVVELVTNSVKYAHPTGVEGKIRLGCRRNLDGTITVEISDDGVGLPEGLDPMKAGTLGLRLVYLLAGRIGARIGFSQDPLGVSFVLELPAATSAQL